MAAPVYIRAAHGGGERGGVGAFINIFKARLVRERPYITLDGVIAGTKVLDRYSFPSATRYTQ